MKKIILFSICILFVFLGLNAHAFQIGDIKTFNIESEYDLEKREEISAVLIKASSQLYWYLDNTWWNGLNVERQAEIRQSLNILTEEFENRAYPSLTSMFGSEWSPGIDRDTRITILVHPLIKEAGGYFNSADGYSKLQVPESNEREMIYLNAQFIDRVSSKTFLAHEFMHLITFNQKNKNYGVSEEIWLNEARAEYVSTFLGYDDQYEGSNLERRISNFLDKPYDSLTEWKNNSPDYGVIHLFIQYLVDHYGIELLADSLLSSEVGIASLNKALKNGGFEEDFTDVFTNWTIAVLVNDCTLGPKYCYVDGHLKSFKLSPLTNFLPRTGKSTLSTTNTTTDWAGNWHKFVGGQGNLKLEFSGAEDVIFKVPYVVSDLSGKLTIEFLELDQNQNGEKFFPDFGENIASLTIIPSIQSKTSGFTDREPSFSFFWQVSTGATETNTNEDEKLINELLAQIEFLKKEIAKIQAQIQAILAQKTGDGSCKITNNLYYGLANKEVTCLQEFLKSQGPEIYPQGFVTGNFLSLTKLAVIRFQEKHASDILAPLGLERGTGFVGYMTRMKINEMRGQ